jgi:hypothetical protein
VEWTNFCGWTLPIKFHYSDYQQDYRGEWVEFASSVGRTLLIGKVEKPANVFIPSLHQTVWDYRFKHPTKLVDAIPYYTTNSHPLPKDAPALHSTFAARVKAAPLDLAHRAGRTRWVIYLMIFLLSIPIIAFYLLRRRQTRSGRSP